MFYDYGMVKEHLPSPELMELFESNVNLGSNPPEGRRASLNY